MSAEAPFLSAEEIAALGISAHPTSLISRKASFHGGVRIIVGAHTRIDDFCVISAGAGGIAIGSHVHVGAATMLIGKGAITLADFATLSGRVSIYSSSDDYSGAAMTNPTVAEEYKMVDHRPVRICRHVIVGAGSVVLPGVTLQEGAAIGALSLVKHDVPEWVIAAGCPARTLRARRRDLLRMSPPPRE